VGRSRFLRPGAQAAFEGCMLATWVSLCYSVQQTVCPTYSLRVLHRACVPLLIVFIHHENGLVSRGVRSSFGQWEDWTARLTAGFW
jgi:hypothetical protein